MVSDDSSGTTAAGLSRPWLRLAGLDIAVPPPVTPVDIGSVATSSEAMAQARRSPSPDPLTGPPSPKRPRLDESPAVVHADAVGEPRREDTRAHAASSESGRLVSSDEHPSSTASVVAHDSGSGCVVCGGPGKHEKPK
jgi:hypothetical protein